MKIVAGTDLDPILETLSRMTRKELERFHDEKLLANFVDFQISCGFDPIQIAASFHRFTDERRKGVLHG